MRLRRGARDVCGVLPTYADISDVPGVGVPRKGTQTGKTQRVLHVQILEGQNCYSKGGTDATPAVQPMWVANTSGKVGVTQTYAHV